MPESHSKPCVSCGAIYLPKKPHGKYCSRACYLDWYNRTGKERRQTRAALGVCNFCGGVRDRLDRKTCAKCRWSSKLHAAKKCKILKDDIIKAYGGCCTCCREQRREFLALDHIYNDGNAERRNGIDTKKLYRQLRRAGYPKDRHQLLCHNCNQAKSAYGYCPHERERE